MSPEISLEPGKFYNASLRAVTPKGSVAIANRLICDIGIVQDITLGGRYSVSRDHSGGPNHAEGYLKFIDGRSEEQTSELQSLMRISYAVLCLKKKIQKQCQ